MYGLVYMVHNRIIWRTPLYLQLLNRYLGACSEGLSIFESLWGWERSRFDTRLPGSGAGVRRRKKDSGGLYCAWYCCIRRRGYEQCVWLHCSKKSSTGTR